MYPQMFIAALFITYGSNLSFHQQMNGQRYGIQYNEILLNFKKNEILPSATSWMGLDYIMLSEIIQAEKDKYCVVSLIYRI